MAEKKTATPAKRVVPGGDKKAALETALAQIEKQFGKGAVMKLGRMCLKHKIWLLWEVM